LFSIFYDIESFFRSTFKPITLEKEKNINHNQSVNKIQSNSAEDLFFENRIELEFLNTKQAAQYLGISENALRIKVCRGLVPHFKFGRQLRFKIIEISKLLLRKDRYGNF
jgi:excisionase family DNA binding protein